MAEPRRLTRFQRRRLAAAAAAAEQQEQAAVEQQEPSVEAVELDPLRGVVTGDDLHRDDQTPQEPPKPSFNLSPEEEVLVSQAKQSLVGMWAPSDVQRFMVKRAGLSEKRAQVVMAAAHASIMDDWSCERPELLARLLSTSSLIAANAIRSNNHSSATTAVALIAKLSKLM